MNSSNIRNKLKRRTVAVYGLRANCVRRGFSFVIFLLSFLLPDYLIASIRKPLIFEKERNTLTQPSSQVKKGKSLDAGTIFK